MSFPCLTPATKSTPENFARNLYLFCFIAPVGRVLGTTVSQIPGFKESLHVSKENRPGRTVNGTVLSWILILVKRSDILALGNFECTFRAWARDSLPVNVFINYMIHPDHLFIIWVMECTLIAQFRFRLHRPSQWCFQPPDTYHLIRPLNIHYLTRVHYTVHCIFMRLPPIVNVSLPIKSLYRHIFLAVYCN